MKKRFFAVLLAALTLTACTEIVEEIPAPENAIPAAADVQTDAIPGGSETEPTQGSELVSQTEAALPTETASPTETAPSAAASDDDNVPFDDDDDSEIPDDESPDDDIEEPAPDDDDDGSEYTGSDGSITDINLTFYRTWLYVGESSMPYVTMTPSDAPDQSEIWTSSDESVATVDWMGNITAVGEGECTVTVRSAACPEIYAEVAVTVKNDVAAPTFIDGILVVNKTYALPRDYNPRVDPEAQSAFDEMQKAAGGEGLNIYISSGFRSYDYQKGLYDRYVQRSGKAEADRYSARAGHSEHQTGLAFDLNTIDDSFAQTEEYVWVKKHCAEYGFIIRYPEGKEDITGYMYEPWHLRYLGKDTAKKVYDSGLTLEEYLGIDSKYDE